VKFEQIEKKKEEKKNEQKLFTTKKRKVLELCVWFDKKKKDVKCQSG